MAFDILNAPTYKYSKSAPSPKTWSQAKAERLAKADDVIEQAKKLENQNGRLPTGREEAGCWIRSDSKGNNVIGWKIGNKFVWFQDGQNLYRCSANWESDFRDLKKQVSDGVHDKAIEDCFNRPNKRKASSE